MWSAICIIFLASTMISVRADFHDLFLEPRIVKRHADIAHQVHNGAAPVTYGCPMNSVLSLAQANNNMVKIGCGMPTICNQVRSCNLHSGPGVCSGKANFLHMAHESQKGGPVSGSCCQFSPPVDEHSNDNCYTVSLNDVIPERPMTFALKEGSGKSVLPVRGASHPVVASKINVVMALFFPAPAVQPNQLVKGIIKTATGYTVTICTIQCDKTTTTHTPSTQQAPSTQKVPQNPLPSGGGSNDNGNSNSGGSQSGNSASDSGHSGSSGSSGSSGHLGSSGSSGSSGHSGNSGHSSGSGHSGSSEHSSHSGHSGSSGRGGSHGRSGEGHSRHVNYGQKSSGSGSSSGSNSPGSSGGSGSHLPSRITHYGEGSNSQSSSSGSSGSSSGSSSSSGHSNGDSHSGHGSHSGGGSHEQSGHGGQSGHSGHHGSHGGSGGGGCFSAEMTVTTKTGVKHMEELVLGEEVLVATVDNIESYQPIEWFYHQNKNATTDYVTIVTQSNRTLSLTPAHLLTFVPCFPRQIELQDLDSYVNYDSVFARKAQPGLCLAAKNGDFFETDVIVSVSISQKRGVYSPVTTQGTLIVNDIQASCYSIVESHFLQYGMHKCLLYLRNLLDPLWKLFSTTTSTTLQLEVPPVLWFLLEVAEVVLPSITY